MQTNIQRYGLILMSAAAVFLALSTTAPWGTGNHGSGDHYGITLFGVSRVTSIASRVTEHGCSWSDQSEGSPCTMAAGQQAHFKQMAAARWLVMGAVVLLCWALVGLQRARVRRAGWASLLGGMATVAAVLLMRTNIARVLASIGGPDVSRNGLGVNAAQFAATLMFLAGALLLAPSGDPDR